MSRSSGRGRILPSMLAMLSLLVAMMASVGVGSRAAYAQEEPSETGNIAVIKRVCEDIGQQDTCMGRDTSLAGFEIDFQIFEGEGTDGELVDTVTVTLGENEQGQGNVGGGSQGRAVSEELPVGTFTVCEVEVARDPETGETVELDAEPRPDESTGGANQREFGENCIVVELTPGTAELQFLNTVAEEDDQQQDDDDQQDDDQQEGEIPDNAGNTGAGGMAGSSLPVGNIAALVSLLAASGYAILRRR